MTPPEHSTQPTTRPVRPRHAASLVILRGSKRNPEVLLGRRPMTARFMPGVYVFPGGALERGDKAIASTLDLQPDVEARLSRHGGPERARALAWTAIRETWEETGFMVGKRGNFQPTSDTRATRAFKDAGLIPSPAKLDYIVRAVTPTHSPIRFDTRFFMTNGHDISGELIETNELEDIGWYAIRHVLTHLNIMGVTRFVLEEAQRNWQHERVEHLDGKTPVLRRRACVRVIRRE